MSAFPAVIDLSTLNGSTGASPGFRLDGIDAFDFSGWSVASAGDVNGDGFADLIIGATYGDGPGNARPNAGETYVVFGKASGFAASLDLATLDGTNGFRLDGISIGDASGASVASAGDVNGDGFADLIIGASRANVGVDTDAGQSYVVFGRSSAFAASLDLATLNGSNGFRLDGIDFSDRSGYTVAAAGDVNGDGFADVIIGAPFANHVGPSSAGASYVVFGRAAGFATSLDLANLTGSAGFRLDGIAPGDRSGTSVASAGDFNGDGFADLIIGAPYADAGGRYDVGASYVVFGKASGFGTSLGLNALDGVNGFRLDGIQANDLSGRSVASAGDVNGDGFADLIIGATGGGGSRAGESYVVFGKTSGFAASLDLATLNGSNGFRLDGIDFGDSSGFSVASAGDVNGDGFADLIVGAYGADRGSLSSVGESYVVFGKALGFAASINLASLNGSNGFRLDGIDFYDRSGTSVASAGDVNGDGFADLVIGARNGDGPGNARTNAGESYVVFGRKPDAAVVRSGSAASQTLAGGDFDDVLSGLGGNDSLWGHGGNDVLDGGLGNDKLLGGDGADTASYASLTGGVGVTVSLAVIGTQNTIGGGIDTLISIENLTGSAFADTLTGDGGDNVLEGGLGTDMLDGGAGTDTASYVSLMGGTGVTVSLAIVGAQNTIGAGTDTLTSIENLTGSAFADELNGDGGNNTIIGGLGADVLFGGAGDDTFIVVAADLVAGETIDGGADTDTLRVDGGSTASLIGVALTNVERVLLTSTVGTRLEVANAAQAALVVSAAGAADSVAIASFGFWGDFSTLSNLKALHTAGVENVEWLEGGATNIAHRDGETTVITSLETAGTEWKSGVLTFGSDDKITSWVVTFDDDRVRATDFFDGLPSYEVTSDPSHHQPWSFIYRSWDEDGVLNAERIDFDGGISQRQYFVDGVRTEYSLFDLGEIADWYYISYISDPLGVFTGFTTLADNGIFQETAYVGGVKTTHTTTDTGHIAAFDTEVQTFNAAGQLTQRDVTLDSTTALPGDTFHETYVNGQLARYEYLDLDESDSIESVLDIYQAGVLQTHTINYDTGPTWVFGNDAAQTLTSTNDDEYIWGRLGADTFVFGPGNGTDRIMDFENDTDRIDLTAYGIHTVTDIKTPLTDPYGHLTIDLGNGNSLKILGLSIAQFDNGDFV